jgi:quercetin dioxygenase-like cupin family protein
VAETLKLSPTESVEVQHEEPALLDVVGVYAPKGSPPPPHLHPAQDERFKVLEGRLMTRVDGVERGLGPGEQLEIPRGVKHQMWNAGSETTRAQWQTRPAGRTREWFAAIDRLHRMGRVGRSGMPGPLAFGVLLSEYDDVFRLAVPAAPLARAALSGLGAIGRLRGGYLPD